MDTKLEEKLVEKYPTLYSGYGGDITKTCMGWGMECDDGWFELLDELSEKLEPYNVVASQVKEKFGGLRFYIESCDEDIYDIVEVISGPFKGSRARVIDINISKEEVTVELLAMDLQIPVKISGDAVRVIEKSTEKTEEDDEYLL